MMMKDDDDDATVDQIEDCAAQVVRQIQLTIERLRSTDAFRDHLKNKCSPEDEVQPSLGKVKLYEDRFSQDVGIQRITKQCGPVLGDEKASDLHEKSVPDNCGMEKDRYRMVSRVTWPLLCRLGQCYAVLDTLPQTPPPPAPAVPCRRSMAKPSPPRGLLSIQQYTDIAVLMEFLVCTSILPQLQSNFLGPVNKRVKQGLPSSLAGRIPRASLLWGVSVTDSAPLPPASATAAARVVLELKQTVTILGQVVLLDRFRPMLLPRHVADVHAAIFQAEALEQEWMRTGLLEVNLYIPEGYDDIVHTFLPHPSMLPVGYKPVESFLRAKSYQTLLLQGTQAPPWLRQRVSLLLMEMAGRDLTSIVQVFVQMAPAQDRSGASLRLAGALTAGKMDDSYSAALCSQLVELLDARNLDTTNDFSQQAGSLTVWAVTTQLSMTTLFRHVLPHFAKGLIPDDKQDLSPTSAHRTVRRIVALLHSIPSSAANCLKIVRLLLCPVRQRTETLAHGARVTLLGQILRLASTPSVLECDVKQDAVVALRLLCSTMVRTSFPVSESQSAADGSDLLAMALLYAIPPTDLDLLGFRYVMSSEALDTDRAYLTTVFHRRTGSGAIASTNDIVKEMESRVGLIVGELLAALNDGEAAQEDHRGEDFEATRFPSRVFHLLLLCYFSSLSSSLSSGSIYHMELPPVYWADRENVQWAVMLMLPRVCEECSAESLLLAGSGGMGILSMIKLILDCAGAAVSDENAIGVDSENRPRSQADGPGHAKRKHDFHLADAVFRRYLDIHINEHDTGDSADDLQVDTLLSTASLVVSMVIAMLDFGSKRRSKMEEAVLQSMVPSLTALAEYKSLLNVSEEDSSSMVQAEMAEMASYAMTLIAARTVAEIELADPAPGERSEAQVLTDTIQGAENDLKSTQPPIRARGVLSLRRLAHDCLEAEGTQQRDQPLITQVMEGDRNEAMITHRHKAAHEVFRVSLTALADLESYVYLAGIQAIVAVADVSPRSVIPLLGEAVCAGVTRIQTKDKKGESTCIETALSDSQRVKVTEALLFVIRRRGRGVDEFVSFLMNLMLYGRRNIEEPEEALMADSIQEHTHEYFLEGPYIERNLDKEPDTLREEKALRVRTGGPVFETEERDLVRSACITVVSELLSASDVDLVARHCPSLIRLVKMALMLDASRPVRRAAALLCNALYCAVLREQEDAVESPTVRPVDANETCLAVEMVASDESSLVPILERCINDEESAKSRLYDPATAARCLEALSARNDAVERGIIAAATLRLNYIQHERQNPVVKAVRSRLKEGTGKDLGTNRGSKARAP